MKGYGFLRKYGVYAIIALWGVACFAFFQWRYPYHFFYKEQQQLFLLTGGYALSYLQHPHWAATYIGDFLTQFWYYLFAGSVILTGCLLVLGDLTRRCLQSWHVPAWAAYLTAILVMTLEAVFHWQLQYPLSATIVKIVLVMTLWVCTLCWKRCKPLIVLPVLAYLFITLPWRSLYPRPLSQYLRPLACGKIAAPDFDMENLLAVENEYAWGNDDKVIRRTREVKNRSKEMLFFHALAQARRGALPEHLLDYPDVDELGTFYAIGPTVPGTVIRNMHHLYWALGDMTYTERAAMMANVFSPGNRNVAMMRRLAEANIVSGDTLAAEKYLRILRKTLCRRNWARKAWDLPVYQQKRETANRKDTLQTGDNCHVIMMQLLDSNPHNVTARDYMLCSDLLLKEIESFKRDYDRYCMATGDIPHNRLYQEALCIYLAGTGAPQADWEKYIRRQDVLARFAQYNNRRGSSAFRDTYWYYFDRKEVKR